MRYRRFPWRSGGDRGASALAVRRAAAGFLLLCAVLPPTAARALDLPGLLAEVQSQNPMLVARRAMAQAAGERVSRAGAWDNPMLEFGAVNVPSNGRFDMEPMTMTMVGLAQKFPLFGSRGLARQAARDAASAAVSAAEFSRFEALGMAWESYADAFYAGELARTAGHHRGAMNQLLESARARVASGTGRLDDALRAEAEGARVLVNLSDFEAERHSAWARLQALRGVGPEGEVDTLVPFAEAAVPTDPSVWLAAVSPGHPRLRELDATVSRYRNEARSARRMVWPDIELRGSYSWRRTLEDGTRQDNMFSATAAIMLPLFASRRELAEAREMDAMARAGSAERLGSELELRQQVSVACSEARAARRNVRLLADTVLVVQRRALEASWASYRAGATDLWRVFEASHELYNEEIALIRARQALARAEARLVALTGRVDLFGVVLPPVKE
ncbi:MAG: TolC family protein [Candidatus Eisenbacteria bacterium]|nr:TolC family protein [Candidatus Eisenbacteria bacterium]